MSIADLRRDYSHATLSEHDVDRDPIKQFEQWFQQTLAAEIPEPNAMSLATVGQDGKPSLRIVLLKDVDARGFTWYTNYESRKGEDLLANPQAALTFHWIPLERQVRIEGRVERGIAQRRGKGDLRVELAVVAGRGGRHGDRQRTIGIWQGHGRRQASPGSSAATTRAASAAP